MTTTAERTEHIEGPTSGQRYWTPGQDNTPHTTCAARGRALRGGETSSGIAPAPANLVQEPKKHQQGTGPAEAVVEHSATQLPPGYEASAPTLGAPTGNKQLGRAT